MKARSFLPDWDCAKCTAGMKKVRGCYEEGKNMTLLGDDKVSSCPLRYVRDNRATFNHLLKQYRFFDKGLMPEVGGLGDQPASFVEAMEHIGAAASELEAYHARKRRGAPGAPRK